MADQLEAHPDGPDSLDPQAVELAALRTDLSAFQEACAGALERLEKRILALEKPGKK